MFGKRFIVVCGKDMSLIDLCRRGVYDWIDNVCLLVLDCVKIVGCV